MNLADVVAAIMFTGVLAYGVFGGADFGSGLWDLTAGGARKGARLRTLIDHAIGPVWEANHVWLIFVLVYLFTAFPTAFAAICETLFVPLSLVGLGIVFRGSAFAFRKFAPTIAQARLFGVLFAISSVLTPFLLGAIAGAIAAGRVPLDGRGDTWTSWTGAASLVGGTLAVLTTSFLAAVFLTHEAGRQSDRELQRRCRARAIGAGIVTGVVALAGIAPLEHDAPHLFDRLTGRALPLIVVSALGGAVALWALVRERTEVARVGATVAVGAVLAGVGVAQYPWVLVDAASVDSAAAGRPTLWALVVTFAIVVVTVLPSLAYMLWLTQGPAWRPDDPPSHRRRRRRGGPIS